MLSLENLHKNVKLTICRFLSYGDILAFGQTCKANYRYVLDNDFWAFLLIHKFKMRLNMTTKQRWRYKFLEMTIKNKIEPYLDGDYDESNKHIEKIDNVLKVEFGTYVYGYYCFIIQSNGENHVLSKRCSDFKTHFLYDRRHRDLVLLSVDTNLMTVIDTQKAEIIRASFLSTNMAIFDIQDQLDETEQWVREDNVWSFKNDKYKITLNIVVGSLVVESVV